MIADVIIADLDGYNAVKRQGLYDLCQRKAAHQIIQLARDSLGALKMNL